MTAREITVHCRVRNEEQFVRQAIESVLPIATKVLVYDTGSTDGTLEAVSALRSDKIEVTRKPPSNAEGIMQYRNEMIDRTSTEWFMLVDGDEVYMESAIRRIAEELPKVSPYIHRIVLRRKHFVESPRFVSRSDWIGRIYRTRAIRHKLYSDKYRDHVGHETPYRVGDPSAPLKGFSTRFPPDIFFFHCHYLRRSSRDQELGRMRRWRLPLFPVQVYRGPWPEGLGAGEIPPVSLGTFLDCSRLNLRNFSERLKARWSGRKDRK